MLTPYKTILAMSKDAVNTVLATARSFSAKKKAELELAKLDERIATLNSELEVVCSEKDINFERIIDKLDDIALAERRKGQFATIISEMFPN